MGMYFNLHSTRQMHASGYQPISQVDLSAFISSCPELQSGVKVFFRKVVSAMDATYLNHYYANKS